MQLLNENSANVSVIKDGIRNTELTTWREFIELIDKQHSNSPAFIYRGQACADWRLESTFDRMCRKYPRFESYPRMLYMQLNGFRVAARGKRGINATDLSDDDCWILGQQHGLATPMLDWTYSPFVALFFAFEDEHCLDSEDKRVVPSKRAVFRFSPHLFHGRHQEAPTAIVPRREVGYRLNNQASVFLKMPVNTDLESYVRSHFKDEPVGIETLSPARKPQDVLDRIIIPNDGRIDCLKLLNKMNINRMSLFPDVDGAASYLNKLWELDADWPSLFLPDSRQC